MLRHRRPRETRQAVTRSQRLAFETVEQRLLLNAGDVMISEFMAINQTTLTDEDGEYSDWIEIHNSGAAAVDMTGWELADSGNQWIFPAMSLGPDEFRVIFASGKDRSDPGGELHTNFSLRGSGERLSLSDDTGVTIHDFGNQYPEQRTDLSYGIAQDIETTRFVETGDLATYLVPETSNDWDSDWNEVVDFLPDVGQWSTGEMGLGYVNTVPGFAVTNYRANTTVSSLAVAEQVIASPGMQNGKTSENIAVINYYDSGNGYGHFAAPDDPEAVFPGLLGQVDNFVIEAIGLVDIPTAGEWSFGVNSDDGFGLELSRGANTFSMSYPGVRASGDTIQAFNLPEAGKYNLRLVYYERGGGAEVEMFASQGAYATFSDAGADFQLVGDTAGGGLAVSSEPVGGGGGTTLAGLIDTDVKDEMEDINSSMFVRIPFTVDDPALVESLTLKVKYDAGYVAYLNGVEIARNNASDPLQWDSSADAERTDTQATTWETVDVTAYRGLLVSAPNVLAIHAMNSVFDDEDFLILAELAEIETSGLGEHYFAIATPGEANTDEYWLYVKDTKFSHDRGFYEEAFDLEITTGTEGAVIYYTTDGSEPTQANGMAYTGPITITTTTVIRAAAFKQYLAPTDVDTQTYLFLDDVLRQPANPEGFITTFNGADFAMDPEIVNDPVYGPLLIDALRSIPTMSIVTSVEDMFGSSGIHQNTGSRGVGGEKAASVELINTDGTTAFQVNAGLRIYGGAFRGMGLTRKKSFRLLFKSDYGPTKLNYPLFGEDGAATSFDTIILRAGANDGWNRWGDAQTQYITDEFMRRTQLALGQPASHGTFVHLYINGLYWGLYNPVERPEASFAATYFGGEKEEWDAINSGQATGDSNTQSWQRLINFDNNYDLSTMAAYQRIQGNNPDGTNNPAYEDLLDVDNYIDYMFSNFWGGTGDWPSHNWYAAKQRGPDSTGFKSFNWDSEGAINIWANLNTNRTGVSVSLAQPYAAMRNNPEFQMLFADHVHRALFNDGPATANAVWQRYKDLADEIELAIIGESARWGDQRGGNADGNPYTQATWTNQRDWVLDTYMPQRPAIVLQQMKNAGFYPNVDAPSFNVNGTYRHGGVVDMSDSLTITNVNGTGILYYTLDGSDPRVLGGGVSGSALVYGGAIELLTSQHVKSRILDNGVWSALNEATYYIDLSPDIRITEIMYNPADPTQEERDAGHRNNDDFEFIEIQNTSATDTLPLVGLRFDDGVNFTFGPNLSVAPGEYVVVVKDQDAFELRYPNFTGTIAGEYQGSLNNGGETILLSSPIGGEIQEFRYKDGWYGHTDGEGFSLTIRDPQGEKPLWNEKVGWRASEAPGGSPGTGDTLAAPPASIIINEVLAHSNVAPNDRIEIHNTTGQAINIGGWFLSDEPANLTKYEIAAGTVVLGNGYVVFSEDDHFGSQSTDPGRREAFALSELGEQVILSSSAGGVAGGYREHVDFGASPTDVSFGLHTKSTGGTDFTLLSDQSFGSENDSPLAGDLVINELMYHPLNPTADEAAAGYLGDGAFEFVELLNRSAAPVDLREYYLGNGVGFSFGWYDADAAGNESWTLQPGATATWTASSLPAGSDTYEVFARWNLLDGEGNPRDLDGRAKYRINYDGGSTEVERDQKPELDDEGPNYIDQDGWVSLGTYIFDGAAPNESAQVVLTRGTNNPSNWTLADQVKFVSTTHTELVDNPTLSSWSGPTTLDPGEYLVLVSNYDAFDLRYDIVGNGIPVAGVYTGNLANNGEKVKLMRAGIPEPAPSYFIPYYRADYVNYDDEIPWPTEPDGGGYSMNRDVPADYGNDPANWSAGAYWGTPGEDNLPIDRSPPTVPADLSATVVVSPENGIELAWTAAIEAETHVDYYNVYRDGQLLGTSVTTTYVDTDVTIAVTYAYEVSAVNRDRYESAKSASIPMAVPGIDTFSAPDETTIRLVFSEPLVQASAEDVANYAFTGGAISGAVLQADETTVLLTAPELAIGQSYTLTIDSLNTVSGSLMPDGQQIEFEYYPTGSGSVLREVWPGIPGGGVSNLTSNVAYPDSPYRRNFPTLLEAPVDLDNQYGTRMRGYVHPDVSGNYTFWIASDDGSELYLSPDEDPAGAILIASVDGYTNPRDWTANPSQQSAEVYLSAGLRYYFEVLHKEGTGGDHVAVAWQRTGGPLEGPIPGERLSPYVIETLDNTPPDAPQDLVAEPLDSTRIELTWTAAIDPESGVSYYVVYRDGVEIATTATTGYINTGLDQTLTYTYEVAAVNGDNFLGNPGDPLTASPLPGIESVDATGDTEVVVTFGKPVTEVTAETVGNYTITDFDGQPVAISSAVWNSARADEVTLTLADPLLGGVLYTLTVELVEDNDAQPIEPNASAQFVFGDLHPDLLAWWTFDLNDETTTYDVSGNNHHLSVFGAEQEAEGRVGGAYRFDGSAGDYLLDDDAEDYINGLSAFTFAAWLKSDSIGTDNGIYYFRDPSGNDRYGFRYDAQLQQQNNQPNGMRGAVQTSTGAFRWESQPNTQTTEWQHFAMTWSSGQPTRVYLNGLLVTPGWLEANVENGTLDDAQKLLIGRGSEDANSSWAGLIDEVRIYGAVLTPEEILELIDTEAPTADIIDVTPDPRITPVDWIDITLSESGVTGLDLSDLSLTRDGGENLLIGNESLTAIDDVTWRLGDLTLLTAEGGNYRLTLTASGSGIYDATGKLLAGDAIEEWANAVSGPTVDITPVGPDPRASANAEVEQIEIVFSEPITGFDMADLSLTRGDGMGNNGPNLLTGGQTLTSADGITWLLGGLSDLTGGSGTYTLTLSAVDSGIEDFDGESLVVGAVDTWATDATAPQVDVLDVDPDPRDSPVDEITLVFTEPVFGLTVDDLILTRDGVGDGENLLTGDESLSTVDNITWILSGLGTVTSLPEGTVGLVAYNDHIKGPNTHPNTTYYDAVPGDADPAGPASGPMKDIVTGLDSSVTLTVTHAGAVFDYKSNPPAEGTPAYEVFNGYIDFSGSDPDMLAGVNGFGASIEIAGEARYVHTFSGLDTGDELTYSFTGTSIRGKVNNRWTLVTLEGVVSAVPVEQQGDGMYVLSSTQIAIVAGQNDWATQGFVAAWTGIDPGPDGEFSAVSTHYKGTVPDGASVAGNKTYALTAVRLTEELATGMPGTYTLRVLAAESAIVDAVGNPLRDDASDTWVTDVPVPTADIVDVTPDPRDTAVDQLQITLSKPTTGLDIGDLTLTRDGGENLLTGDESLQTGDETTWTLGELAGLTAEAGTYLLTLTAEGSGIADAFGYPLLEDASDTWVVVESGSQVVGRHIFYNNSAFDGNDPDANAADYAAIAPSEADAAEPHLGKTALLPGATATFQNYTSYTKGINGVMVDIDGLPVPPNPETEELSAAADFIFRVGNGPTDWSPAPEPLSITVARGDGVGGSDRVTIIWQDNAIKYQWLQVTVRATDPTGLAKPDVFYFGNAPGEAGDQANNAIVNATDEIAARNFQHGAADPAAVDDPYDYDRDGAVDGTDQIVARSSQTNPLTMLRLITAADAAIRQIAQQQPPISESLASALDWLSEFEAIGAKDGSAKNTSSAEDAVDALLATDWQ